MIYGIGGPITVACLFVYTVRIIENKDAKKNFNSRYYNDEINFMLNNSVLNVTNIWYLCNIARDTKNINIKNDIKSLHMNLEMPVTVKTSLLIVALKLICDADELVLLVSES